MNTSNRIGRQAILTSFQADVRGQITILFGLALTMLVVSVGGGIDLARAYQARQRLSQIATLACQYASRPSVAETIAPSYSGSNGTTTYRDKVRSYITAAVTYQQLGTSQTNADPFTFTVGGTADVNLNAVVPTTFMTIMRITQMPVSATAHCYDNTSSLPQIVANGNSAFLVKEGFETSSCSGACYTYYSPSGSSGTRSSASNSFPTTVGYTGANGSAWYIMGYCIEIDAAGVIKSTTAEGTHSAELDCDNGGGGAGNSSISTKIYMPAGNYELRYNYVSRVDYPDYDPTYICGTSASDLSWATNTNSSGGPVSAALRTNQINVYLDVNSSSNMPATHTTTDGTQTLAGSNLIDMCVYAQNWIERSVRIYVSTPGDYWLSFAADGQNDSYGGQLDNVRLCPATCSGALADNFPSAWVASGSTNKVLFEDTFEDPTYSTRRSSGYQATGNLNNSQGTSGTSSSGWPSLAASGWATAPYNAVSYFTTGNGEGSQSIQLDMASSGSTNTLTSRPFLLVPGYYRVDYQYVSGILFSSLSDTYCGATPTAANVAALSGSKSGTDRRLSSSVTAYRDTNIVGVFMSHGQLLSTPIGGGSTSSQTSYTNPGSTSSSTAATNPPNAMSLTSYDSTQNNPLLDICGYASTWQSRTAYVSIQKAAYYWLTFSALGTNDSYGGAIDDVKLTALGGAYLSSPPSTAVSIPVPDPQPGSKIYYTGFYIVADPVSPPAALQ